MRGLDVVSRDETSSPNISHSLAAGQSHRGFSPVEPRALETFNCFNSLPRQNASR